MWSSSVMTSVHSAATFRAGINQPRGKWSDESGIIATAEKSKCM